MEGLRGLGALLGQVMTCPVCGKSKIIRATGWKGHGTGQHGSTHYDAATMEAVGIETHCICAGGPCDQAGLLGPQIRMAWRKDGLWHIGILRPGVTVEQFQAKAPGAVTCTSPRPDYETMCEWRDNGVCEAVDGCRVEPDGVCEHGMPSWLLALGVI